MRIYTLWIHDGDPNTLPWTVASTDEVIIDEWNGFPDQYKKAKEDYPSARELVINIPDAAVKALFAAPEVKGMVSE